MNLSDRELATVLASLRHWQRDEGGEHGSIIPEFFVEHQPLTTEEIDELCERINVSTPEEESGPLMRCPECKGTRLRVSASVLAVVDGVDMSADANQSDVEWGNDSYAECQECDWEGVAADLYPPSTP